MADDATHWVIETTAESFSHDVFERSRSTLVVVDFWAEWCQPCRLLGPQLEALAAEFAGRFTLVKAETEKVPAAAAEFQVQGIPAVYAVVDGNVVDFFVGALPPGQLREWLQRQLVVADVARAQSLEASDPAVAEALYRELEPKLPNVWEVPIGLARVLAAQHRDDEARAILERLARRGFLEPAAEQVRATIELRSQATPGIEVCQAAVAADPNNLPKQLELGEALAAAGRYAEALEVFLRIVPRDRSGAGEKARQFMVDIFRVLPGDSELTREYRRKLSTALY
ncbi:MAG: tetratricopeptide repeat protein [Pirellulales bacterium]